MQPKSFYNTISAEGAELENNENKALSLEALIFELYKLLPDKKTPFQVSTILIKNGYKYPLWSIRRAITNLTQQSKLNKSKSAEVVSKYKVRNHTWCLNKIHMDEKANRNLFPNVNI